MPNQIRLTVLGPHSGERRGGREYDVADVVITAPAGTVLASVTGGLSSTLAAAGHADTAEQGKAAQAGQAGHVRASAGAAGGESVAVYHGPRRLDPQRHVIGEEPLVDGAVLSLHAPAEESVSPTPESLRLEAVSGPDSGGVYLLHPGQIRIGRSSDADVVLDDPDVSRLHCVVSVTPSGEVTVADLDSTNGTLVDGRSVDQRPRPLTPGSVLRVGESGMWLRSGGSGAATGLETGHDTGSPGLAAGRASAIVPAQRDERYVTAPDPHAPPGPVPPRGATTHGAGYVSPSEPNSPATYAHAPSPLPEQRRNRGLGSWARRLGGRPEGRELPPGPGPRSTDDTSHTAPGSAAGGGAWGVGHAPGGPTADGGRWPDSAELLLTALSRGPRLWERDAEHVDRLSVRLGTTHYGGPVARPAVPVTVNLRESGSLGLAGPRGRLLPLVRSVLAQLAALHPPSGLEIVVLASGRGRAVRDWTWLGWLPHLRPSQGQDCRLLFGFDRDQAAARAEELTRRLEEGPLGSEWVTAGPEEVRAAADNHHGPVTVLLVDGDPGTAALRESVARLAVAGAAGGVHVVCLAETSATTATSPLTDTLSAAYSSSPAFRRCGAVALLSGAVATAVRVVRRGDGPAGELATVDGVSLAWAQRFARALAPVPETPDAQTGQGFRPRTALPPTARLLDELGLARATPAALLARWASAADEHTTGTVPLVLGAGEFGPVSADLAVDRSHLLISGGAGSGKTELLCSLAAALSAGERPDLLGLVLIDGAGQGLSACGELPHVSTYHAAGDPVRMREFAQALSAELKHRAELLAGQSYDSFTGHPKAPVSTAPAAATACTPSVSRGGRVEEREVDPLSADGPSSVSAHLGHQGAPRALSASDSGTHTAPGPREEDRGTLRLRRGAAQRAGARGAPQGVRPRLPRLAVLVDDFDALVDPALGNPGRPAAGSVVRALEAVARDGAALGVHLIATTGRPDRTSQTVTDQGSALRVSIGGDPSSEEHRPGRGVLHRPDGSVVPFQGARVTGRIPRTATTRPTVVPLDWNRAGDPPTQRSVRELGNGPTDLALLASAVERAAKEAGATPPAPLTR